MDLSTVQSKVSQVRKSGRAIVADDLAIRVVCGREFISDVVLRGVVLWPYAPDQFRYPQGHYDAVAEMRGYVTMTKVSDRLYNWMSIRADQALAISPRVPLTLLLFSNPVKQDSKIHTVAVTYAQ